MSVKCEVCYKKPQGESADVHKESVNKIGKGVLATPKCVVNKIKNTAGSRRVLFAAQLLNACCKAAVILKDYRSATLMQKV